MSLNAAAASAIAASNLPTTNTTTTTATAINANIPSTMFDVEAYSARYAGEAKFQRLLLIAQVAALEQPELSTQAYGLLERHLKQTGNLRRYHQVFGPQRDASVPESMEYDVVWVEDLETKARTAREVLCSRLSAAQSHLHKDAIRSAYLALAEHDRHYGDEPQALRSVLQSRDYCTSRNQTAQVCVLVLELALSLRNFAQVRDYVTKTEHTLNEQQQQQQQQQQQLQQQQQQQQQQQFGSSSNPSSTSSTSSRMMSVPGLSNKLKISSGLERLAMGDYHEAARKFSLVSWSNNSDLVWNTVTSPEDVATYAGLLSLATASRAQLIELIESAKDGLELVPPVRDALRHYGRAEYKACLQLLHTCLLPQLEWDCYLRVHLQTLYQQICEKCIMEYVRPYQRLSLQDMEQDLGLVVVEDYLYRLIGNGQLAHATLDARARVLVRQWNEEDLAQRRLQQRMAQLGRHVLDDGHAMIIRWACLEHDIMVRAERSRSTSSLLPPAGTGGPSSALRRPMAASAAATAAVPLAAAAQQRASSRDSIEDDDDDEEDDDDENLQVEDIDVEDTNMTMEQLQQQQQQGADNGNQAAVGGPEEEEDGAIDEYSSSDSSEVVVADIPMADASHSNP